MLEAAVDNVSSIEEAVDALRSNSYDVSIFDLDEWSCDSAKAIRRMRSVDPSLKVLVCGNSGTLGRVANLIKNGALDFILRPVRPDEFRMRVLRACNGQTPNSDSNKHTDRDFGPLRINPSCGEILLGGKSIDLTPRERGVLRVLLRANGNVVSKDAIASRIFSVSDSTDPKAIETYIHRLRRKTKHPSFNIETVRGFGYRLRLTENA